MRVFVGSVALKKLIGTWRALHFVGASRGRWFFGFVRFEHISEPQGRVSKEIGLS